MAHVRFYLVFLLVLICRPLWADELTYALVRRIQGIENLPPSMARQLEKVSLQVVLKQKGYQLLLSGTDTPKGTLVDMVAVEPEISRRGELFRIEARLIDVKSKKLLTRASRDNIREEDVVRLFQGAMEAIFASQEEDPEIEKDGKPKEKDKPKSTSMEKPEKKSNTVQINTPNQPTIDFKKRIADLQSGVDKQLEKVVDKKEEAAKKKEEAKNKIANLNLINQMEAEGPHRKEKPSKVYERSHRIAIGHDSRSIKSVGLVETTTEASAITLRAKGHSPTSFFDGRTAYTYEFAYGIPRGMEEKPPALYQLGLYGTWLEKNWNISVGVFRDSSFFVNLSGPGEGLLPYGITSTWTRVVSEVTLPFKWPWKISASYNKPMQVESNYKLISGAKEWAGSSITLDLTPHFKLYNFEFNVMLETLGLSTQGEVPFTFNESRLAFSIRRSM